MRFSIFALGSCCIDAERFYVEDCGLLVLVDIIQTTRLGESAKAVMSICIIVLSMPEYAAHHTKNPLRRGQIEGQDFFRSLQVSDSFSFAIAEHVRRCMCDEPAG